MAKGMGGRRVCLDYATVQEETDIPSPLAAAEAWMQGQLPSFFLFQLGDNG